MTASASPERRPGRPMPLDDVPDAVRALPVDSEPVVSLASNFDLIAALRPLQDLVVNVEQARLREQLQNTTMTSAHIEEALRKDAHQKRDAFPREAARFACFLLNTVQESDEWQIHDMLSGEYDVGGDGRARVVLFCRWRCGRGWAAIAMRVLKLEREALDVWRHRGRKGPPKLSRALAKALGAAVAGSTVSARTEAAPRGRRRKLYAGAIIAGLMITGAVSLGNWFPPTSQSTNDVASPSVDPASTTVRVSAGERRETSRTSRAVESAGASITSEPSSDHAAPTNAKLDATDGAAPGSRLAELARWYNLPRLAFAIYGGGLDVRHFGGLGSLAMRPDGALEVGHNTANLVAKYGGAIPDFERLKWFCEGAGDAQGILVECHDAESSLIFLGWREEVGHTRRLAGDFWELNGGVASPIAAWILYDRPSPEEGARLSAEVRTNIVRVPGWYACALLRAFVWSRGATIDDIAVAEGLVKIGPPKPENLLERPLGEGFELRELLADVARHYLERALTETHGNKTKAAALVGFASYQTLTNWARKHGVEA